VCLASTQLHLLGFVETRCKEEVYCFELRVEKEYLGKTSERITVRYSEQSAIYDPENYQLSLHKSKIIEGSHLRLLLAADPTRPVGNYNALIIWIGD
jgi:hypothetical protein